MLIDILIMVVTALIAIILWSLGDRFNYEQHQQLLADKHRFEQARRQSQLMRDGLLQEPKEDTRSKISN